MKERRDAARQVVREFAYNYLLSHSCEECGKSDVRVLEFHHTTGKDIVVGAMVSGGYSIERILAEIKKCTILCANCHRKLTVEEKGWFRKNR